MCGIAGFCDFNSKSNEDVLRNMTDAVAHRGPNDKGYKITEAANAVIGLGHRRLSILDLSANGHQPMVYNQLMVVFNGEIYNFKSIRSELMLKGYNFESNSDTEVILKGYDCWGIEIVEKMIGMFSFAIFDRDREELVLVRDRAGVKPLYYFWKDNLFLFASELKSFHQHPLFRREIDFNSLNLFLQFSYIPAPYTIFRDTHKLRPGCYLHICLKTKKVFENSYWDINEVYNRPKIEISETEAIDKTEQLMQSAYQYRMVSDVPVGVFLSGGYDSSSVAAMLQSTRTEKLKTFTIGFHENEYNEANEAKRIASFLGTDHHEWYVGANDAAQVMKLLPEIYDEPFADNSVVPTILVSILASKDVKVALSADGGDEIFGGYKKFSQSLRYTTAIPSWAQGALATTMSLVNPERIPYFNKKYNFSTRYEKMKMIFSSGDPVDAMKYISQYITEREASEFLNIPVKQYSTCFEMGSKINDSNNGLNRMLAIDYQTFLPDNNLVKVDRATMSVGLEGREPMLDHRLIEFVSSLPSTFKIKNGINKYILKEIVHKYIPRSLMDRPKRPFIAPLTVWFKAALKEQIIEYLNIGVLTKQGIFNAENVIKYRDRYLNGENVNYQKLWHILVFQIWYNRWMS